MNEQEQCRPASSGSKTAMGWLVVAWLLAALVLVVGPLRESAKLGRLEALEKKLAAAEAEVRAVQGRAALTARYLDRSRSALECWREVAVSLPAGVEITSFSYSAAGDLKIAGESADVAAVYDFKLRMDQSKLLGGATLLGPRLDAARKKQIFEVALALNGGGK